MTEPLSLIRIQQASDVAEKIRQSTWQIMQDHHLYTLESQVNTLQLYLNDASERLADHYAIIKIWKLVLIGSLIGIAVAYFLPPSPHSLLKSVHTSQQKVPARHI